MPSKKGSSKTVEERLTELETRMNAVEATATEAVAKGAKPAKGKAPATGAPKLTTYPQYWKHLYTTDEAAALKFFNKKQVDAMKKDTTINSKKGKALVQAQTKYFCDLFKSNPDIVTKVKAAFDKYKNDAKEAETADDKKEEDSESGSESGSASGSGSESGSGSASGSAEEEPKKGKGVKAPAKGKSTADDSDSGSDSSSSASAAADGSGSEDSDSDSDSASEAPAPAKGKGKAPAKGKK